MREFRGLESGIVRVVPHDFRWVELFAQPPLWLGPSAGSIFPIRTSPAAELPRQIVTNARAMRAMLRVSVGCALTVVAACEKAPSPPRMAAARMAEMVGPVAGAIGCAFVMGNMWPALPDTGMVALSRISSGDTTSAWRVEVDTRRLTSNVRRGCSAVAPI